MGSLLVDRVSRNVVVGKASSLVAGEVVVMSMVFAWVGGIVSWWAGETQHNMKIINSITNSSV